MSYLIVLTLQSSQRLPKESYRTCSRSIGKNCFCNISESWPLQYAGFWWLWPFLLQVHNEFFNKWPKQKASSENRSIFSPYAKWRSTGCNTHLWRRDLMLFFSVSRFLPLLLSMCWKMWCVSRAFRQKRWCMQKGIFRRHSVYFCHCCHVRSCHSLCYQSICPWRSHDAAKKTAESCWWYQPLLG